MFKKISMKFHLVTIVVLLCASQIVIGVAGFFNSSQSDSSMTAIYNDRVVPLRQLKIIADAYAVSVIDAVNKMNAGVIRAEEGMDGIQKAKKEIREQWNLYIHTTLTAEEARLSREAEGLFKQADDAIESLEVFLSGKTGAIKGELNAFDGPLYEQIDPISNKISELVTLQLDAAKETFEDAEATGRMLNRLVVGIILFSCAIGLLSGWRMIRSVMRQFSELAAIISQLSSGELTIHKQSDAIKSYAEVSKLVNELNRMSGQLNGFMHKIQQSSQSLETEAQGIAQRSASSHVLSDQTASVSQIIQQKSSVAHESVSNVSAAMEEMAATIQEISHNTTKAKEAADTVRIEAQQADGVIQALSASAHKIGEVSRIIGGIAAQTNLLALNATIEAARAGESGKGFSVVANEVKELAKQTGDSVTQIENMIREIQTGADSTTEVVSRINSSISLVADLTNSIASAVEEQTAAANEIARLMQTANTEVSDVSRVAATQIVEISQKVNQVSVNAKNASGRVNTLVEQLQNDIGVFKV